MPSSHTLLICFGGLCPVSHSTSAGEFVSQSKALVFLLLLIIVGFIDLGCFNVCCSVVGMWNVKISAFYGNKGFFMIFFFPTLLNCIRRKCASFRRSGAHVHEMVKYEDKCLPP